VRTHVCLPFSSLLASDRFNNRTWLQYAARSWSRASFAAHVHGQLDESCECGLRSAVRRVLPEPQRPNVYRCVRAGVCELQVPAAHQENVGSYPVVLIDVLSDGCDASDPRFCCEKPVCLNVSSRGSCRRAEGASVESHRCKRRAYRVS
jgi:hypothetical protein